MKQIILVVVALMLATLNAEANQYIRYCYNCSDKKTVIKKYIVTRVGKKRAKKCHVLFKWSFLGKNPQNVTFYQKVSVSFSVGFHDIIYFLFYNKFRSKKSVVRLSEAEDLLNITR